MLDISRKNITKVVHIFCMKRLKGHILSYLTGIFQWKIMYKKDKMAGNSAFDRIWILSFLLGYGKEHVCKGLVTKSYKKDLEFKITLLALFVVPKVLLKCIWWSKQIVHWNDIILVFKTTCKITNRKETRKHSNRMCTARFYCFAGSGVWSQVGMVPGEKHGAWGCVQWEGTSENITFLRIRWRAVKRNFCRFRNVYEVTNHPAAITKDPWIFFLMTAL